MRGIVPDRFSIPSRLVGRERGEDQQQSPLPVPAALGIRSHGLCLDHLSASKRRTKDNEGKEVEILAREDLYSRGASSCEPVTHIR